VSDPSFDFAEIIQECLNFVYVATMGKYFKYPILRFLSLNIDPELSLLKPSSIAIASALLAL
jgi:hypothetical protein